LWAQIAALRKELASRTQSFTEHDILAVPDEDLPGGPASAGWRAAETWRSVKTRRTTETVAVHAIRPD